MRRLIIDPAVRATALTRVITLVGAPVSLYLVATQMPMHLQGYYFVAINIVALAQLFELGLGTIIVQFASHEASRLQWGDRGRLAGERKGVESVRWLLGRAERWYGRAAALVFLIAGVGGVALYGPLFSETPVRFAFLWLGFVAATALYLLIIPFVCVAEACGDVLAVQRMRALQACAVLIVVWPSLLAGDPFFAALLAAGAQLGVAAAWTFGRHSGLFSDVRSIQVDPGVANSVNNYPREQRRSAQLWLGLHLTPQLVAPIVLFYQGGDIAGKVGLTMAIAMAPLTLATAWLHARYPSFGAMVASGLRKEFDAAAQHATRQAVIVFIVASIALTGVVLALPSFLPAFAARILPAISLVALNTGVFVLLLQQAMAGWLRAFRDESMNGVVLLGFIAVALVTAVCAAFGNEQTVAAGFLGASVGLALPLSLMHFSRVRRERLAE